MKIGVKQDLIKRKIRKEMRRQRKNAKTAEDHIMPPPVKVEPFFDDFVAYLGGKKIQPTPAESGRVESHADYYFEEEKVLIELKALSGDYSLGDILRKMVVAAEDLNLSTSDIVDIVTLRKDPNPKVTELFRKRFRRYLEHKLSKAKKQLYASAKFYGREDNYKVIFLFNDTVILPKGIDILDASSLLMKNNLGLDDVDAICYYSGNIYSLFPWTPGRFLSYYPIYRNDEVNERLRPFLDRFGSELLNFHANFHKRHGTINKIKDPRDFLDLFHESRQIRT